jgi:CO dehydrogenase/acetyl-CoA synthase gamma subunit (corrinoid Fe-S protein)
LKEDKPYIPLSRFKGRKRGRSMILKPKTHLITRPTVLREFHHVFAQEHIPLKYWDREDMVILKALAKEMRDYCYSRWLVRPAIIEGDTVGEALDKVVKLRSAMVRT